MKTENSGTDGEKARDSNGRQYTENFFADFAEWFNGFGGSKRIVKIILPGSGRPSAGEADETCYVLSEEILRYDTRIEKFTLYLQKEKNPRRSDSEIGWISGSITYAESGRDKTGRVYEYPDTATISGFLIHDENERGKGFGNILITNFLSYVKTLGISKVRARMSAVDETPENLRRRNRIYEKNGFIKKNGFYELAAKR